MRDFHRLDPNEMGLAPVDIAGARPIVTRPLFPQSPISLMSRSSFHISPVTFAAIAGVIRSVPPGRLIDSRPARSPIVMVDPEFRAVPPGLMDGLARHPAAPHPLSGMGPICRGRRGACL